MGYSIYKICCDDCDFVYIGSTQNITKRKYYHKQSCNNEKSKIYDLKIYQIIRENGGWENWRMVCIEELGNITKRQAEMKEEEWRVNLKADLNSKKCYATEEQLKEYSKEYSREYRRQHSDKIKDYREKNKDKIKEYKKEYREQNKNKIKEHRKEHYVVNKSKILEQRKEYYEKNKNKIAESNSEKVTCDCGCILTKCNLATHKKSKKHQELLNNNKK